MIFVLFFLPSSEASRKRTMKRRLEDIREAVERAFRHDDIFYKPWLGYQYCDGLNLDERNPMKTLVIGASRYCQTDICRNAYCMTFTNPAILKTYCEGDGKCNFVSMDSERGGWHKDYNLSDINTASILTTRYEEESGGRFIPRAYRFFADRLGGSVLGLDDPASLWNRIAFVNYLQLITTVETPEYHGAYRKFYWDSYEIIQKIITILEPECIILWTPEAFRKAEITTLFPGARKDRDFSIRIDAAYGRKERQYFKYRVPIGEKDYTLLTCPHPTAFSGKRTLKYFETIREERMNIGYSRPGSWGHAFPQYYEERTVEQTVEDYDDWEDFGEVLGLQLRDFMEDA